MNMDSVPQRSIHDRCGPQGGTLGRCHGPLSLLPDLRCGTCSNRHSCHCHPPSTKKRPRSGLLILNTNFPNYELKNLFFIINLSQVFCYRNVKLTNTVGEYVSGCVHRDLSSWRKRQAQKQEGLALCGRGCSIWVRHKTLLPVWPWRTRELLMSTQDRQSRLNTARGKNNSRQVY